MVPDYLCWIRVGGGLYDYWHNNSLTSLIDLDLRILLTHII